MATELQTSKASVKIRDILTQETGGKSYKTNKYSLDGTERPSIDYDNNEIVWEKTAESTRHTTYVDLTKLSNMVASQNTQILSYFLDGSRRVFKVDDRAYYDGSRSMIFPIIAGQIGVGCCKREDKRVQPEKFKREVVLSLPDIANAGGKPGFFNATTQKLNDCEELKRLGIAFSKILPYKTSRDDKVKLEDKATACVQDRIHDRITGNCATHAYGRTNSIETSSKNYSSLPSTYKNMLTRLGQGDYLIQNPVFRSLLKIRFPKPIYKQFK